jgi:hypothetical protein
MESLIFIEESSLQYMIYATVTHESEICKVTMVYYWKSNGNFQRYEILVAGWTG